jgi:hypothetical protein
VEEGRQKDCESKREARRGMRQEGGGRGRGNEGG